MLLVVDCTLLLLLLEPESFSNGESEIVDPSKTWIINKKKEKEKKFNNR